MGRPMIDYEAFATMLQGPRLLPEQKLACAVFERAIRDYIGTTERIKDSKGVRWNGIHPHDRNEAEKYLFDDRSLDEPFSLAVVADLLGYDVEALRRLAKSARARWDGVDMSHYFRRRKVK